MSRVLSTWLLALTVLASPALGQTIDFQPAEQDKSAYFTLSDLSPAQVERLAKLPAGDPAWAREFAVYVLDTTVVEKQDFAKATAMAGDYALLKNQLRFTPKFPLRPGLTYQAVFQETGKPAKTIEVALSKPPAAEKARVKQVYPTAEVLPENQLRFYLHFSAPMSRGEAYDHLRIIDESNQAAELPILELGEELWDKSGTRLTILIDPGRIKRGVKPREDIGTVFKDGRKYTLAIGKEWHDAAGEPLAEGYRKQFRIVPPVGDAIEPADWKITAPKIGSSDPLIVAFPRPLDHALLERTLSVATAGGKELAGKVKVPTGEQRWEFHPAQPWPAGGLELVVDPTLEDLAGNRIGRPFEVLGGDKPVGGLLKPHRMPLTLK